MEYFKPARDKRVELEANLDYVYQVLRDGNARAQEQAQSVMSKVKSLTGLKLKT